MNAGTSASVQMTYKTILLHCHDAQRASRLLGTAVPLARGMDAHLVGLGVLPPYIVVPATDGAGASMTVEEHRVVYAEDLKAMRAAFEAATTGPGRPGEWREADAMFNPVANMVIQHGRAADLVIISQADTSWAQSAMIEDPERVVLETGRPVLIVPNAGECAMPPGKVTVAWNGGREAARAVFDALPILKLAQAVDVVWIDPEGEGEVPAAEITAALARHGVKCQASKAASDGDAGAALLAQAKAFGSTLLVMGCYGHSRLREFVLGGASRYVLRNMTIPVFMSH